MVCICTSCEVYTGEGMERVYKTSVPEPSARPLPGKETQVTKGTLDTRPLSSARWQKKKDYPLNTMVQFCFFFFFHLL